MAEKTKKPSIWARIKRFFKDFKSETKKITWFSREQTLKSTAVVLVVVIAFAVAIGILDVLFGQGIGMLGGIFA